MTHRWLFFPLALVLVTSLAFAACGGDDDDGDDAADDSATASTSSTQDTKTVEATAATGGVTYTNASAKKLAAAKEPIEKAKANVIGDESAKVTLTVFEDFQCPHCLNYTVNTEPTLMDEYVKTGKVKIEFRHFPILGAESVYAAAAGVCAAKENKFWEYKKLLFLTQAEAGQLTSEKVNVGRFSQDNLTKYATAVGLDATAFTTCFLDSTTVDALTADVIAGQAAGIRGTPGFILNGVAQAGQPADLAGWRKLLDDAVAAAK